MPSHYIIPNWPVAKHIRAYCTTRQGGNSHAEYQSFNLATHVADDLMNVAQNRQQLIEELKLPLKPSWLNQVHGTEVVVLDETCQENVTADASISKTPGQVCAVLTADCLPIMLSNQAGTVVAAIHAGWRGLLAGIIDVTLNALKPLAQDPLLAWLGPAIGPQAFTLNEQIRSDFIQAHTTNQQAFKAINGQWHADIYQLARLSLQRNGVSAIYGGKYCTFGEPERFYSYRYAKGSTGRMASLIWIEAAIG